MPSPELLGYTVLEPPPVYGLQSIGGLQYKYLSRWSTSYTITDDDVPDGTSECDMMVMFLQGTPTVNSWNLSAEWQLSGKTLTPVANVPIFAYYAQYSDTLFPTTIVPKDGSGNVVSLTSNGWFGILLTYAEGHQYGGAGSYQCFNADQLLYGSPPSDTVSSPNFVDGVKIGAAITDGTRGTFTLNTSAGFTERYSRPGTNLQFTNNRGARLYGASLWINDYSGFFSINTTTWEWDYVTSAAVNNLTGAATSFDYDTSTQRFYRTTQASSGGNVSLPDRVEVWDTTTSPANRLFALDQTRIPVASLLVPAVGATPKSLFVGFSSTTGTGPTLIRFDASTMTVLNTYTPAISNISNLHFDTIGGVPYLFVQGPFAVVKINLNTNAAVQTYSSPTQLVGSAYYNQTLWLASSSVMTVRRINADTMTQTAAITTSGSSLRPNAISAGPNGVNFGLQNSNYFVRHINPATNTITASTQLENFASFVVDGGSEIFVMNQSDRLWKMDATTTARIDPPLLTGQYDAHAPFSVIDAQMSGTVGYAPRWNKPGGIGPYGAARFVSLNGIALCEDEGWYLGMLGF